MQITRKESLSLDRYLRDIVLNGYIEFQEKEELILDPNRIQSSNKVYRINTQTTPSPFEYGRGIVYFDDIASYYLDLIDFTTISGTPEQSNRVVLYDKYLNNIDDSSYMIDYVSGNIIMLDTIVPKYIDYYSYYVSVVDAWDYLSTSSSPVIVLDINSTKKKGYQLGGGKEVTRESNIYIFASSSAERSDLTELLYDGLYQKSIPIYDFLHGSVLDYDGTFFNRKRNLDKSTNLFSRTTVSGTTNMRFENLEAKNISLPLSLLKGNESSTINNLNKFRSKLSFTLSYYN